MVKIALGLVLAFLASGSAAFGGAVSGVSGPFKIRTIVDPLSISDVVLHSPGYDGSVLFRCQVHTHLSGEMPGNKGELTSLQLATLYRNEGYDMLAQTQHVGVTGGSAWGSISGDQVGDPVWQGWIPHSAELTHGNWNPLNGPILRDSHVLALNVDTHNVADLDVDTKYYGGSATHVYVPLLIPFPLSPAVVPIDTIINTDVFSGTKERIDKVHARNGLALVAHVDSWPYSLKFDELKRLYDSSKPDSIGVWSRGVGGIGKNNALEMWDELTTKTLKNIWGYVEDDSHKGSPQNTLVGSTWLAVPGNSGDSRNTLIQKIKNGSYYCYYMPNGKWPKDKVPPSIKIRTEAGSDNKLRRITAEVSGLSDPPLSGIANFIDFIGEEHWEGLIRTRRWKGYLANNSTFTYDCNGREKFIRVTLDLNYSFGRLKITSQPILVDKANTSPYLAPPRASATGNSLMSSSPSLVISYVEIGARPNVAPPAGYIGDVVSVSTADGQVPPGAVLEMSFANEDLSALSGTNYLSIYHYDTASAAWVKIGGTVDYANSVISAGIGELGIYCISADIPTDTTSPQVVIDNIFTGAVVSADTEVKVSVNDNIGAKAVRFYMNDRPFAEDTTPLDGWSATIPIANYCTGDWVLKAQAEDLAGNYGSAEVPVYVQSSVSKPQITITSPSAGGTLAAITTINGTCSDSHGIDLITLKIDDTVVGYALVDGNTWSFDLDAAILSDGTRTLNVVAIDVPGNSASASRTVTINSGAPSYAPGKAKSLADGESVRIGNAVVVAVPALTGDGYYIESTDRSSGIRVRTTKTLSLGDKISLVGTVNASASERAIEASDVGIVSSNNVIKPLGITAKLIKLQPDSAGKVVKMWGGVGAKDTAVPAKWFILKDASGIDVKCVLGSGVTIPSGVFATVIGVCSIDAQTGQAIILVVSSSNLQMFP